MVFDNFNSSTLQALLERFFETSFNAIVITTADEGYKIVYANPQFCAMTGYSLSELLGETPRILQGEKTNPAIIRRLKTCLVNGEPFHGATINYRKNGEGYPVEWNISPIYDDNGKISHFISIQKDLSGLKEIVTRLKNTNQHFRKFLGDISRTVTDNSSIEVQNLIAEQQREYTKELVENAKLYSPELRQEENIELFGETEFFDCSNELQGMLVDDGVQKGDKIDAETYCRELNPGVNIKQLEQLIKESRDMLDVLPYSNTPQKEMTDIGRNIQDMANEIFYFEDFVGISSILSELGSQTLKHANAVPEQMILDIYQGILNDLLAWLIAIFIDKNAEDIHQYDASIVSSARQLLMFLKN